MALTVPRPLHVQGEARGDGALGHQRLIGLLCCLGPTSQHFTLPFGRCDLVHGNTATGVP